MSIRTSDWLTDIGNINTIVSLIQRGFQALRFIWRKLSYKRKAEIVVVLYVFAFLSPFGLFGLFLGTIFGVVGTGGFFMTLMPLLNNRSFKAKYMNGPLDKLLAKIKKD